MTCEEFETWLHRQWQLHRRPSVCEGVRPCDERGRDEESSESSTLALHSEECDACRSLLSAHQSLWDGLVEWKTPPLGDDFSQRVVSLAASGDSSLIDSKFRS